MYAIQGQLTDEMIAEAIAENLARTEKVLMIAIAMAAAFVLLTVFAAIRKHKQNKRSGRKSNLVVGLIASILPVVVFGGIIGVVLTRQGTLETDKEHAEDWHVITSEITDLDTEEKTTQRKKKRNGRTYYEEDTDTYYYASVKGVSDRASISASDYSSYSVGESVYVVIDYKGEIALLYSMEDYEYSGSKLEK